MSQPPQSLFAQIAPNTVQPLRTLAEERVRAAAADAGDRYAFVDLATSRDKAEVLTRIAKALAFAPHFGTNLDALYDSLTDLPVAPPRGWAIVLRHVPAHGALTADDRDALIDTFRDASEFHAQGGVPFRVFYSFAREDADRL